MTWIIGAAVYTVVLAVLLAWNYAANMGDDE